MLGKVEKGGLALAVLLFVIAFLASVVGALCGIGGGVIIKPVLDMLLVADVATISFLSGCTVLSMSAYSVLRAFAARESAVDLRRGTPLALGAAVGGVLGNLLFEALRGLSANPQGVGMVQAICLAVVTAGALAYTLLRGRVSSHRVEALPACLGIGAALGMLSSFLGIGGGPINLVVLYFFFSMDTKEAAQNSLYIILFSQATGLLTTLATGMVPGFLPLHLVGMVCGGILGGVAGRLLNTRIAPRHVHRLFLGLMGVIILISCGNAVRFA